MEDNNQLSFPEEDEDLEALRLAALQSLKRKASNDLAMSCFGGGLKDKPHFNGSMRGKQKRGKFPRTPRNGQFNGWTRNSNLIAVPMVTENEEAAKVNDVPKLVLPQDRYCKAVEKAPEKSDGTSKFDRYDNSDESDSESEEDSSKSETGEIPELKRSNSLEALMAELENEIQGVTSKSEEKPKAKPKKKRKVSTPENEHKITNPVVVLKENLKPEPEPVKKPFQNFKQRKWQAKPRRPPPNFGPPPHHPIVPPVVAYAPPPVPNFPPYNPMGFDGVYVPPILFEAPPPPLAPMHLAPPLYERPLSPLSINTDAFSTTLAPLSPRSAAFVMENRAIIEKRKRRSYSRSPSPRFRRSKTPKRSLSPNTKLSKSPKRRSLSLSPIRKVLPPRTSSPKKAPIHDRLGLKASKTEDEDKKKEVLDPVLEARRKKFERNEITMTEGVIRLKKQDEAEEVKKEDELNEEALLEGDCDDAIVLDHKIDTLFSDEESDSDNEGRFKTKQDSNQKVAILPFSKLINGAKSDLKIDLKLDERKDRRKRFKSRSPPKKTSKKSEKVKQIPLATDRKIEIKIRNPAKYEKAEVEEKGRKVEVAPEETGGEIGEIDDEAPASSVVSEGDLRAQLSRKRAERQKHPLPDVVPSRLLQNALQSVGFRKEKKSKKDENTEAKVPIYLRLGAANNPEVFGKKSRKHKNKGSQEQV